MSKKTSAAISSIAMAVAAITCFYAVWSGMDMLPAVGMLLCTIVIFLSNLSAYKKENIKAVNDKEN